MSAAKQHDSQCSYYVPADAYTIILVTLWCQSTLYDMQLMYVNGQ